MIAGAAAALFADVGGNRLDVGVPTVFGRRDCRIPLPYLGSLSRQLGYCIINWGLTSILQSAIFSLHNHNKEMENL